MQTMTKDTPKSTPVVLETVNFLRSLGLMPLPVPLNSKLTDEKNWTDPAYVSDYNRWEKEDLGVGIVLSVRYKLVDIDLDEPGIDKLAVAHLPHKGWVFGRNGKKRSHHVFVIGDETDTTQVQRSSDPKSKGYMDTETIHHLRINPQDKDGKQKPILEYRGDRAQTVMPGTVHRGTGEMIEWEGKPPKGLPASVDSFLLRRSVRKIAFTVMAAKHGWFDGARHELSLAYAGMFANAKWSKEETEHWFHVFLDYVNDGSDRRKVIQSVRDTYKKYESKARVAGGPRVAEITGCKPLVTEFRKLFMDGRAAAFEDMNARYAVGVHFSKVVVFDFDVIDDVSQPDFETLNVNDFHLFHANNKIKVTGPKGDRFIPASKIWFEHPSRRSYRLTDFMPGMPSEVDHKFNLWRGWAVKPSKSGSIDRWRGHVSDFICGGDKKLETWLFAWLADIVQNPMHKPGTAVMMRSGTRTGKNTFVEMMKRVIGIRYVREMNSSGQITSRFNSHYQYALLVFANEADFASSSAATNIMKTLITDKDFHMEHKHAHAKTGRNFSRVVLASNKLHVINRDFDDQRYTVVDVVNPNDAFGEEERIEHFNRVYEEIDNGGPARLLDHLQNLEYDPELLRSCYQSAAGRRQTLLSMNPVAQWWSRCISDNRIRVTDDYMDRVIYVNGGIGWPETIGKQALEAAFRDQHKGADKISSPAFHAMFYEASGIDKKESTRHIGGRHARYRSIILPNVDQAREMVNARFQGAIDEDDPITDDHLETPIERTDEMDEF